MNERSNVTWMSNIYVIRGDFRTDRDFQSKIRGRESIEIMLRKLANLDWVKGAVSLDKHTDKLTPLQRDEWELGIPCALIGDREELVWGLAGDGSKIICRCYKIECKHFKKCRPEYITGMRLPVSPGELQQNVDNFGFEPEPVPVDIRPVIKIVDEGDRKWTKTIELKPEPEILPVFEEEFQADGEQEKIITLPPDQLSLVMAGPGTGKTYSLLRKLEYMVDEEQLVDASDILLLCFTRAAVKEIRERFLTGVKQGKYSDDLSRIDIRTFDSFATIVLTSRGIDCTGYDYDSRIEMCIKEIESNPDILAKTKHLLVDEIQDLVGVRARLVLTILRNRSSGCGFTLLGDHLQAIYDYNVKDLDNELDSKGFLKEIRREYGHKLHEIKLVSNRRQKGKLAVISARARALLETEDPVEIKEFFDIFKTFPVERNYDNILQPDDVTETIAILCRNNGEVLKVSGDLWLRQIKHDVRRQNSRWFLPRWFVPLLGGEGQFITREELDAADLTGHIGTEQGERIFMALKRLTGTSGNRVNRDKVRRALTADSRLPDEFYEEIPSRVTVSTIHQSKGREYDRVCLLAPSGIGEKDGDHNLMEEARVYYVALTRAREEFMLFERREATWLNQTREGNWLEMVRKRNGKRVMIRIEAGLEKDVDEESFVADTEIYDLDPLRRQEYIGHKIRPGDLLELKYKFDGSERYMILHYGQTVGMMSEYFTMRLRNNIKEVYGYVDFLPDTLQEVFVEKIYTVVKKPETISRKVPEPWISTGIWYGISLAGMARLRRADN